MATKFTTTYEVRYVDTDDNKVKYVTFDNRKMAEDYAGVLDRYHDEVFVVKVRHGRGKYSTVETLDA